MKHPMPNGLYGTFDLGTFSLKAAIVEIRDGKERLAAIEEIRLKPLREFPNEDELKHHQIETLKALSEKLPIKECRKLSAVFQDREAQFKMVDLPAQVQGTQLEGVLNWEAKKLLAPNQQSEPFIFCYHVVRQTPFTVALAVVPQGHLQRFVDLFGEAGIQLDGVFMEAFSGLALKEALETVGAASLSFVNIGHTGTHLEIFTGGELRFYRHIPAGMEDFSIPPTPNDLEVYSQKIRFSFDYFRAVSKTGQIDEILFMGGGAAMADYLAFAEDYFSPSKSRSIDISERIDISPVLPSLPQTALTQAKPLGLMPFLPALAAHFANCRPGSDALNLLERLNSIFRTERFNRLARELPVWIGAVGLVLIMAMIMVFRMEAQTELESVTKSANQSQLEVDALKAKLARTLSAVNRTIPMTPSERRALAPLLRDRFSLAEVLGIVASVIPDGVSLQEICLRAASDDERAEADESWGKDGSGDSSEPGTSPAPDGAVPMPGGGAAFSAPAAETEPSTIENVGGELLVLKGTAKGNINLAEFAAGLKKKTVVWRFRRISTRKDPKEGIRFLLKGELP